MDEKNLCETCFTQAGATMVDFIENPFATCAECGVSAEDSDGLFAVKIDDDRCEECGGDCKPE